MPDHNHKTPPPHWKKSTKPLRTKFIFVSGGVLSGLGKGLCAASLGILLKKRGYKISSLKCENYLNIDAGTINPIEHGDPFLTEDGLEADMDLGTYERILDQNMLKHNFLTKGQIFEEIIRKERNMYYGGETVEDVPHIVEEIISRLKNAARDSDICIVEIGGTVGEYQNVLYFETARHLKVLYPHNVINIHVSYLPVPAHLGEPKTKPTQMSVRNLMSMGLNPEFLILRSAHDMDNRRRYILGIKSGVSGENVIMAKDLDSIYELSIKFAEQNFDKKVLRKLNLKVERCNLSSWKNLIRKIEKKKDKTVKIAIAGKYFSKSKGDFELLDAYHALIEAIKHAGWHLEIGVEIVPVNTNEFEKGTLPKLEDVDGIIVPIGWGKRGVAGKLAAIEYARTQKIPYLGLCYGMQLACIEFARNVVGLKNADTEEINPEAEHKIIHSIPFKKKYQVIKGEGTSMRLGAYDCVLKEGSLAHEIYEKHLAFKDKQKNLVSERHRHRFEFNNKYRKMLTDKGLVISGVSPDDFFVEFIELSREIHPFFLATQAHPEYKSRPLKPHPIFLEFLKSSIR